MKRLVSLLVTTVATLAVSLSAIAGEEGAEWMYVVKTRPSEPSQEAEFNRWYDGIDIPDVLAVPDFKRARRAVGVTVPEYPAVHFEPDDGEYVALYDIETEDIDKAIIDLYVAARKMSALGRTTDALKVVEANYYSRLFAASSGSQQKVSGEHYFLLQKILCCDSEQEVREFRHWYRENLAPRLTKVDTVEGTGLYRLYRIMEEVTVGEDERPHLLAIHRVIAPGPHAALVVMDNVLDGFRETGSAQHRYPVRDVLLYRRMSDVRAE